MTDSFEILREVGLPILTLIGGWFAHLFRTKQKKQADVLENVTQILQMQKEYISEQDKENRKTRNMNMRLEHKLDEKRESIRRANWCPHTNEDEGCPVLKHEDELYDKCKDCIKQNKDDVNSED